MDLREMREYGLRLRALVKEMPQIMEGLTVGEGIYAVKQARSICKEDGIVDGGTYRMNFHTGDRATAAPPDRVHDGTRPKRSGTAYMTDVYNNLDYAQHIECGFRSHFVPAKYLSARYQALFPKGMYVGPYRGFVNGRFVLRRAIRRTEQTQQARVERKFGKILRQRLEGGGGGK